MATKGFDLGQLSLKVSTAGVLDVIGGGTGVTTSTGTGSTVLSASPTLSGVVSIAAGTALLPALIPTSDPNTGLWFPAADTVAISTSGVEAVRINAAGDVGIGTASPSTKLTVNANTVLPATAPPTGTNLWVTGADATGSVVVIDSFGSFPVLNFRRSQGTAAAPTALTTDISIGGIGGFGYGATGYTSAARASIGFNTAESWTDTAQGTYQIFRTTAIGTTTQAERMRIDSSGNVTISAYGAGVAKFSSTGVISSGTVTETQGGTNQTTYTTGDILYASASNTLSKLSAGTVNYVLTSGGAGVAPSWAVGGGSGTVTSVGFTGGIISVATPTTTPALTVAGTSGGIPYFSSASTWATSAALSANALVQGGGAGVAPSTITTGTGVITALGVNTGSVGSFIIDGGALGTPSSGLATNLTGTASGLTAGNVTTNANLTGGVTSVGNTTTVITNANLTGNVTSVGNTTTLASIPVISGANLTSLTAANISAGTAGISVTGNAGTVTNGVYTTNKDASGGVAGLTLFKLNLRNAVNTITSFFTTAATVARTWTLPDKDGTVAMTSDITGTNSGTNTGDQTITLTGGVTGSGTGSFAATVITNANLTGGVTSVGNAATVVTNANLTGVVTSTGNATAIADTALSIAKTSGLQAALDGKQPIDAALTALAAGSDFVQFTGPASTTKIFTLPDASSTILVSGGALGTPSSGVATNLTGTASGLTAGNVTTNANLTGDVTSSGNATTLTNAPVIAKVLTGYVSGAGVVATTDSILQAIQKLNGNDATNANLTGGVTSVGNATTVITNANLTGGVTSIGNATTVITNANLTGDVTSIGNATTVITNANLTGDVTSSGNATTLTNSAVIGKVLTGYVSGAGTVAATDSILQAIQKLNGNDATNANLTGGVTSVGNATTVITNANLTGVITSSGNTTSIASQTGTGSKFVVDTSPTLNTPTVSGYTESVTASGIVGAAATLSIATGTVLTATLTSATPCTFTMPTVGAGKSFILLLKTPTTGTATTATFTGVKWSSFGAPVVTATIAKMDILTFVSDGTNWYGSAAQGYTP